MAHSVTQTCKDGLKKKKREKSRTQTKRKAFEYACVSLDFNLPSFFPLERLGNLLSLFLLCLLL